MLGSFLIGLREGLEAALVVGILLAYLRQLGRRDLQRAILFGVGIAVALSLALGAILTFGAYGLSFRAQEIIGGSLSLLAVAMVTWMTIWMGKTAITMKRDLQQQVDRRIARGTGWGLVTLAIVSVAREGIETALFVWSTTRAIEGGSWVTGFSAAIAGILAACALAWLLMRGLVRINISRFFTVAAVLLIILAGGVLAYAIGDLQEAAVVAGPYMAAPTGAPAWLASWYGDSAWAFQLSGVIAPDGFVASLLKGTIGFVPDMSKLSVALWLVYLVVVFAVYFRVVGHAKRERAAAKARIAATATHH